MSEPFVKLPHAVIDHADLDAHELLVYIVLLRFRNPKTGKCYPGLQTIADAARMSRRTAIRTITKLEVRGLIKVDRVKVVGSSKNESNTYTVGNLPEDPLKYIGHSAKGTRVPKRPKGSDSESLGDAVERNSSDSQSLGSDSQSLGVVTPSHPKKNQLKKNNEEDITPTFEESGYANVSFESSDNESATEKQVMYLKDLVIQVGYEDGIQMLPTEEHLVRWRKLTKHEADDLINKYVKQLGRPQERYYPEYGDPEYEALSPAGKEFADTGGMPDSVFEYGFGMKENVA